MKKVLKILFLSVVSVLWLIPWIKSGLIDRNVTGNDGDLLLQISAVLLFLVSVCSCRFIKNVNIAFFVCIACAAASGVCFPKWVYFAAPVVLLCCLGRCIHDNVNKRNIGIWQELLSLGVPAFIIVFIIRIATHPLITSAFSDKYEVRHLFVLALFIFILCLLFAVCKNSGELFNDCNSTIKNGSKKPPERSYHRFCGRILLGYRSVILSGIVFLVLSGVLYFISAMWDISYSRFNNVYFSLAFLPFVAGFISASGFLKEGLKSAVVKNLKKISCFVAIGFLWLVPWLYSHMFEIDPYNEDSIIGNCKTAMAILLFIGSALSVYFIKNKKTAFLTALLFAAGMCFFRSDMLFYAVPAAALCCTLRCRRDCAKGENVRAWSIFFVCTNILCLAVEIFGLSRLGFGLSGGVKENIEYFDGMGHDNLFGAASILTDIVILLLFAALFLYLFFRDRKAVAVARSEGNRTEMPDRIFRGGYFWLLNTALLAGSAYYFLCVFENEIFLGKFNALFFPWIVYIFVVMTSENCVDELFCRLKKLRSFADLGLLNDSNDNKNRDLIKRFFSSHRYAVLFFVFLSLYTFVVSGGCRFWRVDNLTYTFHTVDFSMGFCADILPGAIYHLLVGKMDAVAMSVYEAALLILFFAAISLFCETLIKQTDEKNRNAVIMLLLFFISGPGTFSILVMHLGKLDSFWLYFSLIAVFLLTRKKLYPFVIPVFALLPAVHFGSLFTYVPMLWLMLLYRMTCASGKREKRGLAFVFALSAAVSGGTALYFLATMKTNLVYTIEEFDKILIERGSFDSVYYDIALYNKYPDSLIEEYSQNGMEFANAAASDTVIESSVKTFLSHFQVQFISYDFKTILPMVCILFPVLILLIGFVVSLIRKKENKFQKLVLVCFPLLFVGSLLVGLLFSGDIIRWLMHSFIVFFSLVLFALYHGKKDDADYFVNVFSSIPSPCITAYLFVYMLNVFDPYADKIFLY